jgi:hypothetical protein
MGGRSSGRMRRSFLSEIFGGSTASRRRGYPLLNAADGVLYLVLYGEYLGPDAEICWVDHMCSFDVRNKKLLWHGTVHNLPVTKPAAFP